jgi:hypothetical protein
MALKRSSVRFRLAPPKHFPTDFDCFHREAAAASNPAGPTYPDNQIDADHIESLRFG